jgi:hypothetical protein
MGAMRLRPARTGPDAPLQRPRSVREIQTERPEDGLDRDPADHGARGEHGQRGPEPVAADIAEEDPGPDHVPGQERQRADRDRSAAGGQKHVLPPQPEAGKDSAADERVRGGDAVDPIHEVERVDEGGDPERDAYRGRGLLGRCQAQMPHEHGGGSQARHALQR